MGFVTEERSSQSTYIETITFGYTEGCGTTIRPAESHCHMVLVKHNSCTIFNLVGPQSSSGVVSFSAGVELLWIQLRLGMYLSNIPVKSLVDREVPLPGAGSRSFWLNGSAWQFPEYHNTETMIERLVRDETLCYDPLVDITLRGQLTETPARTVRHHFLHATGMTQNEIFQLQRAQQAAERLKKGHSILDTVFELGYYDQPHLTRSLKRWIGYTPAQIQRINSSR